MASAVPELQAAFGNILLLESTNSKPSAPTGTYPKWTGEFRLFDLPREVRDLVYLHALHRPNGYDYVRPRFRWVYLGLAHLDDVKLTHRIDLWREKDGTHTSLYLTSKQVYAEAVEVFYRYSELRINYKTRLAGPLRFFPEKPARLLRRIRLHFRLGTGNWGRDWPSLSSPRVGFAQVIIESRVAQSFFPLVRECTAIWQASPRKFKSEEMLDINTATHAEAITLLLDWMKRHYSVDKLVPPSCLKVDMTEFWGFSPRIVALDRAFSEALEEFKVWGRVRQESGQDSEPRGSTWIQELFAAMPSRDERIGSQQSLIRD